MPQRRKRPQYEQLSDLEGMHSKPQRSRLVEQAYRPPPRSERYGSCSMLATLDLRRDSLPSWRVRVSQEPKYDCGHVLTNIVLEPIHSTPFTTFKTSSGIKGNHSETTGRRRQKEPTNIDPLLAVLIRCVPTSGKLESDPLKA
ncbi:hypothetical protein TNCV_1257291 [Trichonephila clavipes]|nr:hypothetical protein TNCV_1257291 [Trichonephila clavipes]